MIQFPPSSAAQYAQNISALSLAPAAKPGLFNTGIVGTGNSARALAAYLSSKGHRVNFLARENSKLAFLNDELLVKAEGKIEGSFKIKSASSDAIEFAANSEIIFVATVCTAYPEIARRLAPVLTDKHTIILFSAKLGGTLLFENELKAAGCKTGQIMETDALFACRVKEEENSIWIRGFKQWTLFSSASKTRTSRDAQLMQHFFQGLSAADNIIQRGLTDFAAIAHAPIMLANMNKISRQEQFRFYYDGMTDETIRLLESVEEEFSSIANAYGSKLIAMKDLLDKYYTCDASSLYSAMTSVPNYSYSMAPQTLQHRFLQEDICCTLVPARQLASLAGLKTPVIDAIIAIASVLTQRDLKSEGRDLSALGFDGMNYEDVFNYINS